MISRRGFLFGIGATLAVIRTPGLIMPVKAFEPPFDVAAWLAEYHKRMIDELTDFKGNYIMRVHPETYKIFCEVLEPGWKYAASETRLLSTAREKVRQGGGVLTERRPT